MEHRTADVISRVSSILDNKAIDYISIVFTIDNLELIHRGHILARFEDINEQEIVHLLNETFRLFFSGTGSTCRRRIYNVRRR